MNTSLTGRRRAILATVFLQLASLTATAQTDNGIHVAAPKVYDARALEIMMDQLAASLQKTNFIDPKALAAALSNLQGYNSTDFSQALTLNGAVGPNAASVFSGGAASPPSSGASAAGSSSAPTVSINIAPTQNAGAPAAPAASTGVAASVGPQLPSLPSLPTAPTFNPNFGPSGADLLADETNLTYQLFNLRMMLERSLSDRLHGNDARLQAVLGFDIDIEPPKSARDAVALVQVAVKIDCAKALRCQSDQPLSIVALMPEEGSHNAATLSQKASAFGGALASAVYSVGYSAQKRNQTFYLYRDMDTLSIQQRGANGEARFGWQFRPVLGRRTVAAGKHHLIVVLGLPASDAVATEGKAPDAPRLTANVNTSWEYYDRKLQTTSGGGIFAHSLPAPGNELSYSFDVPPTAAIQSDLRPHISSVQWVPTDAGNGVAIVSGRNFFHGTTVRLGNRAYAGAADGLIVKSDQELELAVPSSAVALGGVLSGRYGDALPLIPEHPPAGGFRFVDTFVNPIGNFSDSVDLTLQATTGPHFPLLNPPIVLLNGVALPVPPAKESDPDDEKKIHLYFSAPADAFSKSALITVTFPFAGPAWSQTTPYYDTTLKVTRLSGPSQSTLLLSATNPAAALCDGWTAVLDGATTYKPDAKELVCSDADAGKPKSGHTLQLNIPSATLNPHKRIALTKPGRAPLSAEIPKSDIPPAKPVVSSKATAPQYSIQAVTFTGQSLDAVTKVVVDGLFLDIADKKPERISINLKREVTEKPRPSVELQLLSDGNDPVIATLTVTPTPEPKGK